MAVIVVKKLVTQNVKFIHFYHFCVKLAITSEV